MSRWVRGAVGLLLALSLTGCAQVVTGRPVPAPDTPVTAAQPPPRPMGDIDTISAATVEALQTFWAKEFPATFDKPWDPIDTLLPVHTQSRSAPKPPCVDTINDVRDQAYYCPRADAVVWDADGLLPDLNEEHGAAGVLVVLAHEIGHAVQTRLGVDEQQRANPSRYPTILLEAQADCYAGVALQHFVQEPLAGLPLGLADRDHAVQAMIGFRDPLGVVANDDGAHGNAFDRVSAFQDGYVGGPTECAGMTVDNRVFTQRRFTSAEDAQRKGNLPLAELLPAVETDARAWFGTLAAQWPATGWTPPPLLDQPSGACADSDVDAQGPIAFCQVDGSISVDKTDLAPVHRQLGDFADATLIASRYALAMTTAGGADPFGVAAGDTAVCLAGAYTGRLLDSTSGFSLSPGDLDEAVEVLVTDTWAARDAGGVTDRNEYGFDRFSRFRSGVGGGPTACRG